MKKITATQFASNAMWKFADVICRKLVSLVISVILARLIVPEAYGLIALTTIFITFSDIFILNGFNIALIRKEHVDDIDYSTVAVTSLAFSVALYVIFFLSAPFFADFYENPELKLVLRVITILILFQSVTTVIRAKGTREMCFKRMSVCAVVSNISAGIIGVILAYIGWNVWALVMQQVLANFFEMLLMIVLFRWKVSFAFSGRVAGELFKFTLGVLGSSFLDFLGNNICSLGIGKAYSTMDLGYYNRGNLIPETVGLNTYNAINSVLLPTLASRQNDMEDLKRITRKVVSFTEYLIMPMMFGLIGISNILIPLLLTEKWFPSVALMNFCCIYYAVNPIRSIGYNIFYAKGESHICVRIEIIRVCLMISNLILTVLLLRRPLFLMLAINAGISIVVALITQFFVKKCINYTYGELLADILPSLFISFLMMFIARYIGTWNLHRLPLLIIQILLSVLFYVSASFITKNANFKIAVSYTLSTMNKIKRTNEMSDRHGGERL